MNSIQIGQARVIEVIECCIAHTGRGSNEDPYRRLTQYFSKDGDLLAEVDPCANIKKTCTYKRVPEGVQFGCCLTIGSWEQLNSTIGAFPYCPACGGEIEVVK